MCLLASGTFVSFLLVLPQQNIILRPIFFYGRLGMIDCCCALGFWSEHIVHSCGVQRVCVAGMTAFVINMKKGEKM